MRFVIQRVTSADVKIDGEIAGKIDKGFLVLIGVSASDLTEEDKLDIEKAKAISEKLVKKLVNLRIFDDQDGKTNLDLNAVGGNLLLISQFTLYADCKKGNRPSFINAGSPGPAEEIYEYTVSRCKEELGEDRVERGVFGADMKVSLVNDGPFTVILDSDEIL
ncbi:MAG: D-tyrosyl-tRNA(Tyr) deacylase [Firmicutes bacterium]|nr:D-tyrosyl-tRNA(Tyr) deacylase [Bacillota bacterium]